MDNAEKGFWQAHKRKAFTFVGICVAGYCAYRAYDAAYKPRPESTWSRWWKALSNYAETLDAASGTCSLIASDLQKFLTSDSCTPPQSLVQLIKLLQAKEVQELVRTSVETVAQGAASAFNPQMSSSSSTATSMETLLEALASERGRSILSLAVGIASKNVTSAFCEFLERLAPQAGEGAPAQVIEAAMQVLSSENGDRVVSKLLTSCIRTAISTYIDSTTGYNIYEDMLSSITKQEHRDAVSDIMARVSASFCKELGLAYRKASLPVNIRSSSFLESSGSGHSMPPEESSLMRRGSMEEIVGTSMAIQADHQARPPLHQGSSKTRTSTLCIKQNQQKLQSAAWIKQLADLAREKDVRALAVDVVGSATREATRGVMETMMACCKTTGAHVTSTAFPLYAFLTIMVAMLMYSISPQVTV
jgi:hypothetical protein